MHTVYHITDKSSNKKSSFGKYLKYIVASNIVHGIILYDILLKSKFQLTLKICY